MKASERSWEREFQLVPSWDSFVEISSWRVACNEKRQSDELVKAITSGEVNCLSGSCELYESSSESSKSSSSDNNSSKTSMLEFE